MNVLTASMCYPSSEQPDRGVFIRRRLSAWSRMPGVRAAVISPQPWCPLLRRAGARESISSPDAVPVTFARMVSIPVLGWATDGVAYARAISRYLAASHSAGQPAPDLLDAHFVYPDGVGAWLAGRRLSIPVVVTVRGKIVSLSRKTVRSRQIARMLRGVDARIAVSRSLETWVHRVGGSDLHVDVIPNGIDAGAFGVIDRVQARRRLGWLPDRRYLLSVGHFQRVKGFDRIVEAMPALRRRLGDVRLMLVGSARGERRFQRRLQRRIAAINADSRSSSGTEAIEQLGTVPPDRVNLLMNAADLVVNTSRSEGWSNAIAEALAAGTPVVALDVGGNRELICAPGLGRIVPENHPAALVEALVEGLSTPFNRTAIAARGSARSWDQAAREVHAVFQRVLAARAAAACRPCTPPAAQRPSPPAFAAEVPR